MYKKQVLERAKKNKFYGAFYSPKVIALIVTSKCNFTCKHCFRESGSGRDLPFEVAKKVISEAKDYGFMRIALTGGEPFLYPRIKELIELIVKDNYIFSLVTNGWVFKQFADFLKKYKNRIAYIAFSLESMDKKLHDSMRRNGSFDRLIENFKICRQNKITFRTITAISDFNYDEAMSIGVFARKHGASAVAFTTMLPCPRAQENKLVLDSKKRQELFISLKELHKVIKIPALIAADLRSTNDIQLCRSFSMNDVAIDTNGNIVQCCDLADYDYEDLANNAIVTSLKDKSFGESLKILSGYIHKLVCERIDNCRNKKDIGHIDFNSCFYCVNKLGKK